MSIYYVSIQQNLSGGTGTFANPFNTIQKSINVAVPGDTVYIGSGTYRERPINSTAGTNGSPILFIGDPDSQYLTNDKKGIVRVTGCGTNEIPTAGTVWSRNVDYVTLSNMVIDGTNNAYTVTCSNATNGRININLVVLGLNGIQGGINTKCLVVAGYYAFIAGINTNCVAIAGARNYDTSNNTNCVGIGGIHGFYNSTNINCLNIGTYYSFYSATSSGSVSTNCFSMSSYSGYTNGTCNNCFAFGNGFGFTATSVGNCIVYSCKASLCNNKTSGTLGGDGSITDGAIVLWSLDNMKKILEGFEPWMFEGAKQWGNNSVSAGTVDILGRTRRMLGGSSYIDIGTYAFSNISADYVSGEYQSTAPSVAINQIGMKLFKIPAKANVPISVKVQTNFNSSTTTKPQIQIVGDSIATQTATNNSTTGVWQQLTVSATPTKDEVLTLILSALDSSTSAISYFSDISVV